jgi:hypothetical protein
LAHFYDLADFNKKEDGEPQAYEENDKKTDDCLVVSYLFDLPVLKE